MLSNLTVLGLVSRHCLCTSEARGLPASKGADFLTSLRMEANKASEDWFMEGLTDVDGMMQRLWLSTCCGAEGREFCSMINDALRRDEAAEMAHVAVLARTLDAGLITLRECAKVYWPP